MSFKFAPKETMTIVVSFEDAFNDFKPASFKATYKVDGRKKFDDDHESGNVDWEEEVVNRLKEWNIRELDCNEENIKEVMQWPHLAEALIDGCMIAVMGKQRVQILKGLKARMAVEKLGN